MLIYKILRDPEWSALCEMGETTGAPIDITDGFIHLSTADQAIETAGLHFAGAVDLWVLAFDTENLGTNLKWDVSRGGALFPHLYSKLRLADVLWAKPLPHHIAAHLFPEQVEGHVDPSRAQFDAFKSLPRDHPLDMLNLVRFRTKAAYPKGHELAESALSGAQAYQNYGSASGPIFKNLGGTIVWRGAVQTTLIGPSNEQWDLAFVARYPSAHAFFAMVTDSEYQAAVQHRQAGVRTSRLIRCLASENGDGFA